MKGNLDTGRAWRALLCALLIAALVLVGATAEGGLDLEVNLVEVSNDTTMQVNLEGAAGEGDAGMSVELDEGVIPNDDAHLSPELDLDGLDVSCALVDELIIEDNAEEQIAN